MAPHKKRKISDLTVEDANLLLNALNTFQATLEEDDEDLPPELLPALEKFRVKLGIVPNTSFSRADSVTLVKLGVKTPPLIFKVDKRKAVEDIGRTELENNAMSLETTKSLIQLIRSHVSTTTEAGCRILINIILLRIASVMRDSSTEIQIAPEFPVPKTTFSSGNGEQSFSGILDYLVAKVQLDLGSFFRDQPVYAVEAGALMPSIIEAKKDNLTAAIPQATVAVASFCKQHSIPVMRSCITTGEQWKFFVYRSKETGGEVCIGNVNFELGKDLEGLPLILGLLMDLISNATTLEQQYFRYM